MVDGDQIAVLGYQLASGPPVGLVHVAAEPGLTALYGPNGVGKSRLLNDLASLAAEMAHGNEFRRPGATPDRSFEGPNVAPSPLEAMYSTAGVYLSYPLTRGSWADNPNNPIANALRFSLRPDHRSRQTLGAPDWDEVLLRVMGGTTPTLDVLQAEYLLAGGHWFIAASWDHDLYLCDPDPERGELQVMWATSESWWSLHLRDAASLEPTEYEHITPLRGPLYWRSSEDPDMIGWGIAYDRHGGGVPILPPRFASDGPPPRPPWAAPPAVHVGRCPDAVVSTPSTAAPETEMEDRVAGALRYLEDSRVKMVVDSLTTEANRTLANLFEDPPLVRATYQPGSFTEPRRLYWWARHHPADTWFPLTDLGSGHRRHTAYAISFATRSTESTLTLIDEPEAGLHPSAIDYLASGLDQLGDSVIVATHSVDVINAADHVLSCSRDDRGWLVLQPLSIDTGPGERQLLARKLGLTPGALALLTKVILLVEGPHDVAVIRGFLEPELLENRVLVLPMWGTGMVPYLVSDAYLFASTTAPVIVCTDNADEHRLTGLRNDLMKEASPSTRRARLATATTATTSDEQRRLLELMSAANDAGVLGRVVPFGFDKADIVRYLDIAYFTNAYVSWEAAERAFLKKQGRTKFLPGDGALFKTFIGPSYSVAGIEEAFDRMRLADPDAPVAGRPKEFDTLARRIQQAANDL